MGDSASERWRFHFLRLVHEARRSKSEVAAKAGLSPAWATGVTTRGESPSLDAVDKIARTLSVDVGEFFQPAKSPDQIRQTSGINSPEDQGSHRYAPARNENATTIAAALKLAEVLTKLLAEKLPEGSPIGPPEEPSRVRRRRGDGR